MVTPREVRGGGSGSGERAFLSKGCLIERERTRTSKNGKVKQLVGTESVQTLGPGKLGAVAGFRLANGAKQTVVLGTRSVASAAKLGQVRSVACFIAGRSWLTSFPFIKLA